VDWLDYYHCVAWWMKWVNYAVIGFMWLGLWIQQREIKELKRALSSVAPAPERSGAPRASR